MKSDRCKKLTSHISRIQGQMETLKRYISEEESCQDITQLSISIAKSFDSLKANIVEGFVVEELLGNEIRSPKKKENLEKLMSLIKA